MRTSFLVRRTLWAPWVAAALGLLVACGGTGGPPVTAACTEPTDIAPITDAALAVAVRDALGVATGPTCGELATLTDLDITELGVASLAGLEHAHALVQLGADRNDLADISPVAGLGSLQWFWFGGNDVADVSPLAGLTELRGTSFWNNPVASVAPIAELTKLENLAIGAIPARDHHLLDGLAELRLLHVNDVGLTNLDFVAAMTELEEFRATSNPDLVDASGLASLTKLVSLDLGGASLTDVSFLASLPDLRSIALWGNPIADAGPIEALTGLVQLDIGGTGIGDLAFVANSPDLESLYVWNNGVTDISALSSLGSLNHVLLGGNELTDISPLVANASFAAGATLDVAWNCLDTSPGSPARSDIETLIDRGVDVTFEPQGSC